MRLLLICLLFISVHARAQFGHREVAATAPAAAIYRGDIDFEDITCKTDPSIITGDELYFPPGNRLDGERNIKGMYSATQWPLKAVIADSVSELKAQGRSAFGWELRDPTARPGGWKVIPGINYNTYVYKPGLFIYSGASIMDVTTPYTGLAGKFFKIRSFKDSELNNVGYCWLSFVLEDENGIQVNWVVHAGTIRNSSMHLKSFLVKSKEKAVGRRFYYKPGDEYRKEYYNILDKQLYKTDTEKSYQCTDITFVSTNPEYTAQPYYIFTDNDGVEIAVEMGASNGSSKLYNINYFLTEDEYMNKKLAENRVRDSTTVAETTDAHRQRANDVNERHRLETRYGKAVAKMILEGRVKIGMKKEVCGEAWGEPAIKVKNKTKKGLEETWKYNPYRWLKFFNGVLTGYSD
ncbi:MAG: hypothetical protein H7257_04040 [Taibaiella sp.]|nr:hypothetical protein [Taibaiella sp.]